MPPYDKPALDITGQINHLKQKGLTIADEAHATLLLTTIGYYRLKGFALTYRDHALPGKPFLPGATIEDIANIADIDHMLRLTTFAGIQVLEPAIRAVMTQELAADYGPVWYEDPHLFIDPDKHVNYMATWLNGFRSQRRELFVRHFSAQYGKGQLPPSWMLLETVTLGGLSHIYKSLKASPAKQRIAHRFGHNSTAICESWFHSASHLRNVICHHGRIWATEFGIKPKLAGEIADYDGDSPITDNRRFGAQLLVLVQLLHAVDAHTAFDWLPFLITPMPQLPDEDLAANGLKSGWHEHPLFNVSPELSAERAESQ